MLQHWLFFYLSCQDVRKTQFPDVCAINFISDCWSHWNVRSNWILRERERERERGLCHVFVFFLLCFRVRQGMNYEHFTQVPFDPTLMRSCNKSLRFSSVPAILCMNLFSFLALLFVQAAFRDLWALGGRKMNSQQQALIRFDCSCYGVPMDNALNKRWMALKGGKGEEWR